jgi:hypothetical protein
MGFDFLVVGLTLSLLSPIMIFLPLVVSAYDGRTRIFSPSRMLPVRLVIVGAVIVIVSFIVLLLLITLLISALVFNSAACISIMDDVAQDVIVSAMPLTMLLWWSDAAG